MSARKKPTGTPKKRSGAARGRASKKSQQTGNGRASRSAVMLVCEVEGCARPYKTERGLRAHIDREHPPAANVAPLDESTVDAVKRALTKITDSPRRAVLVASIRRLAEALDDADPTDRPKISKELAARMVELMAQANPGTDDADWTDQ